MMVTTTVARYRSRVMGILGAVLCCTVLYCTVLYCTVLYCPVLYCTVLYCTVLYCTVLYCTVLCCTVLYCTVLYCNTFTIPFVLLCACCKCCMSLLDDILRIPKDSTCVTHKGNSLLNSFRLLHTVAVSKARDEDNFIKASLRYVYA